MSHPQNLLEIRTYYTHHWGQPGVSSDSHGHLHISTTYWHASMAQTQTLNIVVKQCQADGIQEGLLHSSIWLMCCIEYETYQVQLVPPAIQKKKLYIEYIEYCYTPHTSHKHLAIRPSGLLHILQTLLMNSPGITTLLLKTLDRHWCLASHPWACTHW